jgi:ABC-type bacteriocin/lantibiotic exporter with double-glycine peptidase domain
MSIDSKPKAYSALDVISASFKYFLIGNRSKSAFILLVCLLILVKNIFAGLERYAISTLKPQTSLMYCSLIKLLILKGGCVILNFVSDYLFEKQLIPYGGVVSAIVLKKILYSAGVRSYDMSGGSVEYFVTEGAKSMAKINRFIFLGFFSKTVHLFIDLGFVYYKDKSSNQIIFLTVLIGTSIFCAIKMKQIALTLKQLKLSYDIAYEREKQYVETVDNMQIIKSYCCEDESIHKYEKKTRKWEIVWTIYKYLVFLNDMIYDSLGAIFRVGVTALYFSKHTHESTKSILDILDVVSEILKTGTNLLKLHKELVESIELSYVVLEYLGLATVETKKHDFFTGFHNKIELKNISYSIRGKIVFSNVNMTLKRGDKAVLYGRNGAGKSSIFKLLLNFDEYQGEILIDDVDIKKVNMIDYRDLITYVPQESKLFDETIYYNLTFGNKCTYADVTKECIKMGIHDAIMSFPLGYNTIVGEAGKNLNGGLRQKIFYTRALLCDTPIYLFDEPTNNLDEKHSKFLLEYVKSPEFADKTFLVICHDQEIIQQFPKIFKFDNNEIYLEKED